MPSDHRAAFFNQAAELDLEDSDERPTFRAKLTVLPDVLFGQFAFVRPRDDWSTWWSDYVVTKFGALAVLNRKPRIHTSTLLKHLGLGKDYIPSVAAWRALAVRERTTYQLRVAQIGDAERVKETWYDSFPTFEDWATSCLETGSGWDIRMPDGTAALDAMADALVISDASSLDDERRLLLTTARLRELVERAAARLPDIPVEELYPDSTSGPVPVDSVAARLSEEVTRLLRDGKRDFDSHVGILLTTLKAVTSASVVDFLIRRTTNAGEQLELFQTTANVDAERRHELASEAAYSRPIGITGSVLVAERRHELFHVGTNDLDNDPRQSRKHRSIYQEWYGPLVNFWVFPLFVGEVMVGAVRVVNRVDLSGAVVPWSILARRRLIGLLRYVGQLWDAAELDTPQPDQPRPTIGAMTQLRDAGDAKVEALRGFLARERIAMAAESAHAILEWIAMQATVELEDNRLKFSALVVSDVRAADPQEINPRARFYRLPKVPSLRELRGEFGDDVTVVLRNDSAFLGRLVTSASTSMAADRLSSQAGVELALACNARDRPGYVTVWRAGREIGEYLFLPRLGDWRLRDLVLGLELVQAGNPRASNEVVSAVFNRVVKVSSRAAGTIVLASERDQWESVMSNQPGGSMRELARRQASILTLSEADIERMLERDGATVVSADGRVMAHGVTLPSERPAALRAEIARQLDAWERELHSSDRGTKHKAALMTSAHFPEALVFCISHNRTLSTFRGGEALLWNF